MYRIVLSVVGGPEGRKRNAVLTPMCFSLGDVSVGYTMSTVLSFSISSYIITCVRVETRNRRGRCRVRALVGYPQVTRCALRLGTRSTQKKKNNKKLSIDGGLKRSRFASHIHDMQSLYIFYLSDIVIVTVHTRQFVTPRT